MGRPTAELRHANTALPPEAALRLWLEPETDRHFWQPWVSRTPPHYTGSSGVRRRLGGRSLYWYGVSLPIEDWALSDRRWPRAVVDDLCGSWAGGLPLYERVARRPEQWRGDGVPLLTTLPLRTGPAPHAGAGHHQSRGVRGAGHV